MKFIKNPDVDTSKLMYVNSIYHKPCAATDYEDYLDIIYKDLETGQKYVETKKNPEIIAYLVKPEYRDYNYNKEYMEINKCDQYKVPIKDVNFWIAKQMGPQAVATVRNMIASGNRAAIQNLQKYRYVFGTDTDIRSFYMTHWLLEYENDLHKELAYGAADIETDAIKHPTFASNGEVPILCATFVSEIDRQVHTFVYRAKDNLEQIARVEDHADEFVEECHRCFDESYGSDFEYNLYFFDKELDMIKAYYQVINDSNIDILYYWNGNSFDNPYIKARIEILGGDPAEIVSHPDFKVKEFKITKDTKNFQVVNKRDWVSTSTYYQTVDHMLSYTQLRKGSVTLRTNKLNDIAKQEIGDTKLDYSETGNIRTLPYLDFWTYLIYNIKDVLLEIGIERKTTDLQAYYIRSYSSSCPYEFIFAQTKFLQSRMYYEYQLENIVPWNNINIDYGAPPEQKEGRGKDIGFSGAFNNKTPYMVTCM